MGGSWLHRQAAALAGWNPWVWIHAIFVVQIIGSVVVIEIFSVGYRQLAVPLGLLLTGALTAPLFKRSSAPRLHGAWERWIPAAIYAGFIYAMSDRSFYGAHLPVSSNVFHPFEYSFLAVFLSWGLYPVLEKGRAIRFSVSVIACGTLYGISDEIHQYFVPGRSCSMEDLVLDFLGVCAGLAIFFLAYRKSAVLNPVSHGEELD